MNDPLYPITGDRWTLTMEVLSVTGNTVTLSRGTKELKLTLTEYRDLAAATVRNGGELVRTEPEEIGFE